MPWGMRRACGIMLTMSDAVTIRKLWPEEVIEAAYQIWSGIAERNGAETRRQLAAMGYGSVPSSTFDQWVTSGSWKERASAEMVDSARIPADRYLSRLWVAAASSSLLLSQLVTGDLPAWYTELEDRDRDRAVKAASEVNRTAQALLLQRAKGDGKRAVGNGKPVTDAPIPYDSEGLAELERRRREERDG